VTEALPSDLSDAPSPDAGALLDAGARPVLSVALTGNVGSGKSTVARLWAEAGVPVISADELARRAVEPGSPGLRAVEEAFGAGVLARDGTLERARLREIVFSDPGARARLEAILHPRIREARAKWLEERRREGDALVVSEIPLLFETGSEADFDAVVLVDAPPEVRLQRIVHARGLAEAEARRVMDAQMDPRRKRSAADFVIDNDGSLEELAADAARVLAELRERAGGPLRLDLHLHTWASFDCLSDPEAVLRRARSLGYRRIAITDHNRVGVALRMRERHPDAVIPGEEVKTAEGVDVIGLYLREEIPEGTPAFETIERIRAQGGIPYLPHPFARGKGAGARLVDELARRVEVIEVFNARLHAPAPNRLAEELARRHQKLRGAGSDAHTLGEVGNALVELPPHANRPEALLAALARSARVEGSAASRLVHLASTWAKARKRLPGARGATA
jgi:dephospho-CoA kinase